ncbi:MAG: MOSC N-terminal beta barrel domain-containing protein [Burkholderiaceae bacterium]
MNATIEALFLYPIKSCRGIRLEAAELAATGLAAHGIGDREWLIVDDAGEFITQRSAPRMALIATALERHSLWLHAPGMLSLEIPFELEGDDITVRVWNDTLTATTQSQLASDWFTRFLGTPCQLVRFDRRQQRLADPRYTGTLEVPYQFADAFPLLVVSQASLDDFNARLRAQGEAVIGIERFRPNLVLGGIDAFGEDFIDEIRIGELTLRLVKPCSRCPVPTIDPATGLSHPAVGDLLNQFRATPEGVMFGVNAIVTAGAGREIRVGDEADISIRF